MVATTAIDTTTTTTTIATTIATTVATTVAKKEPQQEEEGKENGKQEEDIPVIQRVWVGGLNPPHLTVEMVQKRMKASFEEKFDILSFDDDNGGSDKLKAKYQTAWGEDNRTFFFLTAKSKSKSKSKSKKSKSSSTTSSSPPPSSAPEKASPSPMTPIELISKQYHKVKWKGCSIQVEPAKLHFLQRLEIERIEAKQEKERKILETIETEKKQKEAEEKALLDAKNGIIISSSKKRHLRIRKKHGEEAYMVDTKPLETNNWNECQFTVKKQRTKYQKHADRLVESRAERRDRARQEQHIIGKKKGSENLSLQSKVFLNRSVHFSFPTGDNDKDNARVKKSGLNESSNEHHDKKVLSEKIYVDSDEDNQKSEDVIDDNDGKVDEHVHVSDDNSRGKDEAIQSEPTIGTNGNSAVEKETMPQSDSNDNIINDNIINDNNINNNTESSTKDASTKYEWSDSDDDSDSDSDDETNKKYSHGAYLSHSRHNALDEFASEFQNQHDNNPNSKEDEDEGTHANDDNDNDEKYEESKTFESLEKDVMSNLSLLSLIYPDMKVSQRKESTVKSEKQDTVDNKYKPGWNPGGLMQRYDPTAYTEVKEEEQADDDDDDDVDSAATGSSSDDLKDDSVESEAISDAEGVDESDSDHDDDEEEDGEEDNEKDSISSSQMSDEDSKEEEISDEDEVKEEETLSESSKAKDTNLISNDPIANNKSPSPNKENEELKENKDNKDQIYEQKKLEDIFQQKRSGGGTTDFQLSSLFQVGDGVTDEKSSNDNKESTKKEDVNASKGFSFSFDTLNEDVKTDVVTNDDDDKNTDGEKDTTPERTKSSTTSSEIDTVNQRIELKDRKGLHYNPSELNVLEQKFFSMNEGVDDILSLMDDQNKKEEDELVWQEERTTLTLDWKRKQKYAQTKRNKKMKFR